MTRHNFPFDFQRSWVGLDRVLDAVARTQTDAFPPFNLIKMDPDNYRIELAVAGYSKDEIEIEHKQDLLTIKGSNKKETGLSDDAYMHRGLAARSFSRSWSLDSFMEVNSATLENGILTIDIVRNIPEEKKPKLISIG